MFLIGFSILFTILLKLLLDVTVIKIVPTGQNNVASHGVNVHISEIIKNNNDAYDLVKIKPDGWYTIWDTNIENYGDKDHPLFLRTKRYDSLQITFFNNPYMGIVEIETSEKSYRVDLYTENEYGTTIIDIPFSVSEGSSWPMCIVIGIVLSLMAVGSIRIFLLINSSRGKIALATVAGCACGLIVIFSHVDYGLVLNCCFVASYALVAGITLPDLLQGKYSYLIKEVPTLVFLLPISIFATIASLYTRLIRPSYSFHYGVYSAVQFILVLIYWCLCIIVLYNKLTMTFIKRT